MRSSDARSLLEAERVRLTTVRASLAHDGLDVESQRRSIGELSGSDEHLADVASETAAREAELSLLASVVAELAEVEAALARLAVGSYGTCVQCGRPIADDRLEAVPATQYCVEHQAMAERADAVTADHGCARAMEAEAFAHLDLLPQDDDVVELSAEESAVTQMRPPRSPAEGVG
jgi:RNA polymerase-binding transcription factor DksA